jgi:quercetin dioxygenase-like cupin family protein
MDSFATSARVVPGDEYEALRYPTDEVLLRVTDAGGVQVAEYRTEDRDGPPPHSHPWHEVEYVIEGEVEFFVDGAWVTAGPGAVQVLPAGVAHSVRVPRGSARLLMVTLGAPYDGFARDLADLYARDAVTSDAVVDVARRHGVRPAATP